jgi:hypothetical protein
MDERGKEVENYKITPAMRSIIKEHKRLKRIETVLRLGTEIKKREFENIRDMWESLQMESQKLQERMPKEPLRELEGMDFPEREAVSEEQMQLRY